MPIKVERLGLFLLCLIMTPGFVRASAIEIDSVCELGDCTMSGLESAAIASGQSVGPNSFDLMNFVVGSDPYDINLTSYGASYLDGTLIYADLSVTYTGSGPSTGDDSIRIDDLQDFYNNLPGTWDGNYTENVPVIVGSGTTFQANLCYNGGQSTACVGQVGPLGGGTYSPYFETYLSGLGTGDYLAGDFDFVFNFPAGTEPGTSINLPASIVPEPSQSVPLAIGFLVLFVCATIRRGRKRSFAEER